MSPLSLLLDTAMSPRGYNLACFPELDVPSYVPKVDVIEEKDAYILSMDLPGACESDIDISLKDNNLTIASAQKETEEKKEDKKVKYLLNERNNSADSKFSRTFTLAKDVDSENINASFTNGVLVIRIGRKAEESPKKISIKVA